MPRRTEPCSGELLTFVKRLRCDIARRARLSEAGTANPRRQRLQGDVRKPFIRFVIEMQAETNLFAYAFHRGVLWRDMAGNAT